MMSDKPVIRFKYVWENISDPALYDTITGNCYFINDEDDIGRIVGVLNNLHQENQQLNMSPRCDPNEIESMVKEIHCLKEENRELRQKIKHCVYVDVDNEKGCMNCKYNIGSICSILDCGTHDYLEGVSECGLKYWECK